MMGVSLHHIIIENCRSPLAKEYHFTALRKSAS